MATFDRNLLPADFSSWTKSNATGTSNALTLNANATAYAKYSYATTGFKSSGYMLFSCVAGITVNLAFPVLKWENEVRVVKQSASMLVTMLIGMLSSILPLMGMVFVGEEWSEWICLLTVIILVIVTCILYTRNNKVVLIKISEK